LHIVHFSEGCQTKIMMKDDGSKFCGFYIKEDFNWLSAYQLCSNSGARLPVIKSDKENRDIFDIFVSGFLKLLHNTTKT